MTDSEFRKLAWEIIDRHRIQLEYYEGECLECTRLGITPPGPYWSHGPGCPLKLILDAGGGDASGS